MWYPTWVIYEPKSYICTKPLVLETAVNIQSCISKWCNISFTGSMNWWHWTWNWPIPLFRNANSNSDLLKCLYSNSNSTHFGSIPIQIWIERTPALARSRADTDNHSSTMFLARGRNMKGSLCNSGPKPIHCTDKDQGLLFKWRWPLLYKRGRLKLEETL